VADASLPRFDEDALVRVRTRLYDAIGDLDALAGALEFAGRKLNAAHAMIVSPTPAGGSGYCFDAFATRMDVTALQSFAHESGTPGPYREGVIKKYGARPGLVLIGDQMAPREEVLKSPLQSRVLIPNDCGDLLGASFAPAGPHDATISFAVFWRSRKAPRFELDAADRLRLFVHDLGRMVRVALLLRSQEQAKTLLVAALDRVAEAVLALTADRRLLYANSAARAMLKDSGPLVVRDGKLASTDEAGQGRLVRAVSAAAERAEIGDFAIPRAQGRPVVVSVAPAPGDAPDRLEPGAAAVVIVANPDGPIADAETIARTFSLSEREAELARGLCIGSALAHGLAHSVGRKDLSSIFRKLNAAAEADLVRALSVLRRPPSEE
jgi:PAS domain-containing protein